MLVSFSAFADYGAGAEAGFEGEIIYKPYYREFLNVTCRSDENPWCFSVNAWPTHGTLSVFADNWFVNERINDTLDFFGFWGISGCAGFDGFSLGTGARLGAGIDCFILENRQLELYWQAAWNPYFGIEDDDGIKFMANPLCFPFQTGVRWWFR